MNLNRLFLRASVVAGVASFAAPVFAQTASGSAQASTTVGVGTPTEALPASRSDHDAQPQVAAPTIPTGGIVAQAGVGGVVGYGRSGVLELGGSAGFSAAGDLLQLRIAPSIGWFFMNNVEISGIVSLNYARTTSNGVTAQATSLNVLVEPSIHFPLSRTFFLFGGLGLGLAYADGPGAGFALAPRLGVNLMVGRSGVFTPAATFVYSTSGAVETSQGTLLTASTSFGLNLGYTVMW